MKTLEQLRELLALADKATPGKWSTDGCEIRTKTDAGQGYPLDFYTDSRNVVGERECYCGATVNPKITDEDMEYIAACSPENIREIVQELIAARAEIEKLKSGPPLRAWSVP